MKKLKKCSSSKVMKVMMAMVCAMLFFIGQKTISMADSTGKTIVSVKVRQSAGTNSNVVAGLSQGAAVTIVNEVNDASGTLWYEISAGDVNGYVRSDLIEKSAEADPATSTASQAGAAAGADVGPDTPLDAQYATVTASAAKIRSKASTSASPVDSMPQHTSMIVSGQTTGSDGKIWYYVLFKGTNGEDKTGYVREDLIELGEMVPTEEPVQPEEPEPVEEPVEEPVVSPDYEVVYEDPKGEGYAWYLHDNTGEKSTRQKIEDLITAAHAQNVNAKIDAATISKQRIVIVILVALVIILAVVLTFMFFKLRDTYYEDDDDDADRWKAERSSRDNNEKKSSRSNKSNTGKQEEPVRRKSTAREEQQPPVRKKPVNQEKKAPVKEVTYEDDEAPRPKPAPKKKAKNFLADDDDFEFEFLNMKDKDKGDE